MPGTARAARNSSADSEENGGRNPSRSVSAPSPGSSRRRRRRTSVGVRPYNRRTVSWYDRTDRNPAANATSVLGRFVCSSSCFASRARRDRAIASGPVPSSRTNDRWSWREPTASRRARPSTPSSSTTPSAIRPEPPPDQVGPHVPVGESGLDSGRHRRHARNPASSAAAAVAKNRTDRRSGMGTDTPAGSRRGSTARRRTPARRTAGHGSRPPGTQSRSPQPRYTRCRPAAAGGFRTCSSFARVRCRGRSLDGTMAPR